MQTQLLLQSLPTFIEHTKTAHEYDKYNMLYCKHHTNVSIGVFFHSSVIM